MIDRETAERGAQALQAAMVGLAEAVLEVAVEAIGPRRRRPFAKVVNDLADDFAAIAHAYDVLARWAEKRLD